MCTIKGSNHIEELKEGESAHHRESPELCLTAQIVRLRMGRPMLVRAPVTNPSKARCRASVRELVAEALCSEHPVRTAFRRAG